jgi:gamma-glutamyltranspeptidase/glutathione hydrolase
MSLSHQTQSNTVQNSLSGYTADIAEIWRIPGGLRSAKALLLCLVVTGSLSGCGGVQVSPETAPPGNRGFSGIAVSDEPRVTLTGRDVILAGGNAADAAASMALSLTVTLPSRAGLGGGGMCAVFDPKTNKSEVLDFTQTTAAQPMVARGMAALVARYGSRGWSNAVASAETLARFGFPVSKMLASDLAANGSVLMSDQAALTTFMDRRRQFAAVGTEVRLPQLAETLQKLRTEGAGVLPSGTPQWRVATITKESDVTLEGGGLDAKDDAPTAATSFVVGDKKGMAVTCVLSMGAPFGSGRTTEGGYFTAQAAPLSAVPVIGFDFQHTHVVFVGAAHGAAAADLVRKSVSAWLVNDRPYDDVRNELQQASGDGAKGSINAAVCRGGLALLGSGCRTMTDAKGYGLGQTFGPDTPK